MACACSVGQWTTGKVNIQTVETEKINSFLGMTSKHGPNGFYPEPTVTNSGVESNAEWANIAAVGVATISTLASIQIAEKQYDIANSYYALSRQKWDRFRNVYMPCERREMSEACNTPEYEPRYDELAAAYTGEVDRIFAQARARLETLNARYCVCPEPTLTADFGLLQSQIAGDSGNFAYRYEEARRVAKNDVRWTRRQQSLNRGRDLQSNATQYAKAAADAYGRLGEAVGSAAEGAISAIGYFSERRSTMYPQRAPLQRPQASGSMVGNGFMGVTPDNGTYGWISPVSVRAGELNTNGYTNPNTTYSSPNVITSLIGSQQPSSSGG